MKTNLVLYEIYIYYVPSVYKYNLKIHNHGMKKNRRKNIINVIYLILGLIVLTRHILLDPILICFIFGSAMGDAKFR